jgi:hypothetical protein
MYDKEESESASRLHIITINVQPAFVRREWRFGRVGGGMLCQKGGCIMATKMLKRFSFVIDFIEPDPQEESPDQRARVLGEHDQAIRAAGARMTALLTSDTQIATFLSAHGIQLQTGLSH